jgi:U4/U6.U5 tri-snRNP-associated protein 3
LKLFGLQPIADMDDIVDSDMMQLMGFSNFDSTKNKHVDGNVQGEAKLNRPRKYRQYMNRRGGFNRPLDYVG